MGLILIKITLLILSVLVVVIGIVIAWLSYKKDKLVNMGNGVCP
jgi:hypothetical protein